MRSPEKLVQFLQKQIQVEHEIVKSVNQSLEEMVNPAVKATLRGISFDSAKHAEMYTAAVQLLTAAPPALSQELTEADLEKQRKLVEKHIHIEAQLIDQLTEMMKDVENKKVELLLKAILQDERRHHELLKRVVEILIRGETMTEEWWSILREEYTPRW